MLSWYILNNNFHEPYDEETSPLCSAGRFCSSCMRLPRPGSGKAQAPQSLNGASIRIKTAEEKEILCKAKDLHIILYEPQGSSARLIFTHAEEVNGTFQKIRYKKLSGDEAYDAKEHKGTPALLTFNAVKGSVYHVSVEGGFWTSSSSDQVEPIQSMEIIFPTNVSIHGDEECIEILPETEEFEEPQQS